VIDYLVSLKLGASNHLRNPCPRPRRGTRRKIAPESALYEAACSGQTLFVDAQQRSRTDSQNAASASLQCGYIPQAIDAVQELRQEFTICGFRDTLEYRASGLALLVDNRDAAIEVGTDLAVSSRIEDPVSIGFRNRDRNDVFNCACAYRRFQNAISIGDEIQNRLVYMSRHDALKSAP
jgi:hypothetical protein